MWRRSSKGIGREDEAVADCEMGSGGWGSSGRQREGGRPHNARRSCTQTDVLRLGAEPTHRQRNGSGTAGGNSDRRPARPSPVAYQQTPRLSALSREWDFLAGLSTLAQTPTGTFPFASKRGLHPKRLFQILRENLVPK